MGKWQPKIKLIFLCSPNNPTGNLLAVTDILTICRQLLGKAVIVVDEAYIEFSMIDSLSKCVSEYSNLIILRTLSKAYGLAGVRCGATIANPTIIQMLKKIIAPYPIAKPVVDIVVQQLVSCDITKSIILINQEREKITNLIGAFPFVRKVWKSDANFVLFKVFDAKRVMTVCFAQGVVIRNRSSDYVLRNCIRVTIGTPNENKCFVEALRYV